MDPTKRYKVRAPDEPRFDAVCRVLQQRAEVLVENRKRRTVAATRIDDEAERLLRGLGAEISEEFQYDLE